MGTREEALPATEARSTGFGSLEDLERLYKAEHLAMVRLGRLITGSTAMAEEAVHDAFVIVHLRRTVVEQPGAYLRRVVVNNCYGLLRRRRTERRKYEVIGRSTADTVVLPPELDETWAALDRLSPKQRTALVLRYYEDLTVDAVADAMGERLGTVKSLIHRGLKKLAKEVAR